MRNEDRMKETFYEVNAMVYVSSWFENATPQSVFFKSPGHAKYFIHRLQRDLKCRKIVLHESELMAA